MAYGNQDWAVVLPQNNNTDEMYRRYDMQQRENDRLRKEDQARESRLVDLVGDNLKDSDYMTGTDRDPVIRQQLAQSRQEFAQMIKNNKGLTDADIQYKIQKKMAEIGGLSSTLKNANSALDSLTKDFDKKNGVNPQAAKTLALQNLLYKKDANGNRVPRDVSEMSQMNPQDLLQQTLRDHSDVVFDPNTAWASHLKELGKNRSNWEPTYDKNGRQITAGFQSNLRPFQQIKKNPDGTLYFNKQNQTEAETSGENIDLNTYKKVFGSDPKSQDDLKIASEGDYLNAMTNMGVREGVLNREVKKLKPGIDLDSPEADILRRKVLYQKYESEGKDFTPVYKMSEDAWKARQNAGITNINVTTKEAKEEERFANKPVGTLYGILNGGISVANSEPIGTIENTEYDSSGKKTGNKTVAKRSGGVSVLGQTGVIKDASGTPYKDVVLSADKKSIIFVTDSNKEVVVPKEQASQFFTKISGTNGLTQKEIKFLGGLSSSSQQSEPKKSSGIQWRK